MKKTLTFNLGSFLSALVVLAIFVLGGMYFQKQPTELEKVFAFGASGVSSYGQSCFKDYYNWNSSTTYDGNHDWNLDLVPVASTCAYSSCTPNVFQTLQDVNGDGLADFVFSYSKASNAGSEDIYNCVGLNTGSGWNIVYKCVQRSGLFYGDCAG